MTSPGVKECALCASSVYHVHHASVCVNVVIGVLVVLCELHVTVRVHGISTLWCCSWSHAWSHRSCCYRRFRRSHFI